MRILYDLQAFNMQTYGGISRYFFELMNNFYNNKEIDFKLPGIHSYNAFLKKAAFARHILSFNKIRFLQKDKIEWGLNRLNRYRIKISLERQHFDIFHPTYYEPYFLQYLAKKPFVLTIYDMIHEIFPDNISLVDKTTEIKRELAHKAAKIIAISQNTKKDIIKFFGIDERKIEVIYLANSFNPNKISEIKNYNKNKKIPSKYILYVGNRSIYKNFKFFIESVSPLLRNDKKLKVICAGSKNFSDKEFDFLRDLNIFDKVLHYPVDDNLLIYLYSHALAFVFPSLYEGFGIPVLESFSCRCPLIVSNTSSFPEVAGNAAIYINPEDQKSIKEAVAKVIYNKELRKDLIDKGAKQLKKFSWEKTAEETKNIYEKI